VGPATQEQAEAHVTGEVGALEAEGEAVAIARIPGTGSEAGSAHLELAEPAAKETPDADRTEHRITDIASAFLHGIGPLVADVSAKATEHHDAVVRKVHDPCLHHTHTGLFGRNDRAIGLPATNEGDLGIEHLVDITSQGHVRFLEVIEPGVEQLGRFLEVIEPPVVRQDRDVQDFDPLVEPHIEVVGGLGDLIDAGRQGRVPIGDHLLDGALAETTTTGGHQARGLGALVFVPELPISARHGHVTQGLAGRGDLELAIGVVDHAARGHPAVPVGTREDEGIHRGVVLLELPPRIGRDRGQGAVGTVAVLVDLVAGLTPPFDGIRVDRGVGVIAVTTVGRVARGGRGRGACLLDRGLSVAVAVIVEVVVGREGRGGENEEKTEESDEGTHGVAPVSSGNGGFSAVVGVLSSFELLVLG